MPVRFRGLSEYKRNFKWKTPEFSSPSQQQKSLWAGLRSDQFGIIKEPNFISKRRVPYRDPQISKSFEWPADCDWNDPLETEAVRTGELYTDHNNNEMNQEKIETPEGPRLPPKVRSQSVDSRGETALALAENNMKRSPSTAPPNQNAPFASPKKESEEMGNGLHRVLQRKAGMNISRLNTFPRSSEYQSQFVWKSPHEKSPILAAEQLPQQEQISIMGPKESPVDFELVSPTQRGRDCLTPTYVYCSLDHIQQCVSLEGGFSSHFNQKSSISVCELQTQRLISDYLSVLGRA